MQRIGTFDGGGVRGALTTCFLVELEKQLGKPCNQIFDMVAGCSTGALIAAAVAVGLPAAEILDIYRTDAPKIFHLSVTEAWPVRLARGHAFSSAKVAAVLKERFGKAASWSLNDCPIRILLCATHESLEPAHFVRDNPLNANEYGKLSLVECATASAAAPTYLDPVYISPLGGKEIGWCVDGGVAGSANPVYDACVQAFHFDAFDPAATAVYSFGTGFTRDTAVNPGNTFLEGLSMALNSLLYNAGKAEIDAVNIHWPGILQRFNAELAESIDEADASKIPLLTEVGQKAAALVDWPKIMQL